MQLEKVAIIKEGKDIGRIIPFNMDAGDYDFKISFAKNDYEVSMYPFLSKAPEKFELEDITNWEISYHRASGLKPTVIHLKEKKDHPEYEPLPLHRLVDPTILLAVPLIWTHKQIKLDYVSQSNKWPTAKKRVGTQRYRLLKAGCSFSKVLRYGHIG